jgi:signal transduction histidine kinase
MREEDALKGHDQDLSMIVCEIDRLNRTVSQLLAFSRPSHADARPVELSELISSTMTFATGEAKERQVDLIVESECDVTLTGVQAGALREALSNLVLNAIQATDPGGEVRIQAGLEAAHSNQRGSMAGASTSLILAVTDTGPGISIDSQQRVFEPFYSTKSRGTGLGLAIVRRRVVELGGAIELVSPVRNGGGTRFRVVVPAVGIEQ